jgi:crotonobetainyl-CoA:carnitine CoA-transferase CaiB-like acyl-CoA transferase
MSVSPKAGAPPMAHDTETILLELGYEHSAIERLAADGAVVLGPSRA